MGKYKELLEELKENYTNIMLQHRFNNVHEQYSNSLVIDDFEVSYTEKEINKLRILVEYHISEKGSNKEWDFLIGPSMMLFSVQFKKYRESLLKDRDIKGIFTIKSGFFDNSLIGISVILFGKKDKNIWLSSVTSTDDILSLISSPKDYGRNVYFTNNLDPENFMPERYNDEVQSLEKVIDKFDSKKLGDIAEVYSGKSIPKNEWVDSGIPYLRGRDIQNGILQKSEAFVSEKDAIKYSRFLLQDGDILLSKHFGQHKVTQVTVDDLPAIASNGLIVIRAFGVPDNYLYKYLTSKTGKEIFDRQLSYIEKGVAVQSINLKDIIELKVPIFDEKMMYSLSNIENLGINDLSNTVIELTRMNRLSEYGRRYSSRNNPNAILEENVYNRFLERGWNQAELIRTGKEFMIEISEDRRWRADLGLLNGKEKLAIVEIKTNFIYFTREKLIMLKYVIDSGEIPFLILTTGDYYEIHSANNKIVKKMTEPPTKEYLLSLLDGKEGC